MAEDLACQDPTLGVRRRVVERARDWVLTDDEIKTFWARLPADMSEGLIVILKRALVTGQRIGIAKSELDLSVDRQSWTVRSSRTKNREPVRVPVVGLAVPLIQKGIASSGQSGYVFPSPRGDQAITSHAATRAMSRWRPKLGIPDFRVHDLRRTCATGMARLGIPRFHISLVLDHVSVTHGTITGAVYDKYSYEAEKRDALSKWSNYLMELFGVPSQTSAAAAA